LLVRAHGAPAANPNPFEVLVEDAADYSSDDSCDSDVPFEAALEIVGSPAAPMVSSIVV
jgi:hypothetical protein